MGRIEARMSMPPGYERPRMNEKNAVVRWLLVVGNPHVANQKVNDGAVPQALKHGVRRTGKNRVPLTLLAFGLGLLKLHLGVDCEEAIQTTNKLW